MIVNTTAASAASREPRRNEFSFTDYRPSVPGWRSSEESWIGDLAKPIPAKASHPFRGLLHHPTLSSSLHMFGP